MKKIILFITVFTLANLSLNSCSRAFNQGFYAGATGVPLPVVQIFDTSPPDKDD